MKKFVFLLTFAFVSAVSVRRCETDVTTTLSVELSLNRRPRGSNKEHCFMERPAGCRSPLMGFDNQHGSIHDGFGRKAVLEQAVIFVHGPSVYACTTM